jgi:hypothetical protein
MLNRARFLAVPTRKITITANKEAKPGSGTTRNMNGTWTRSPAVRLKLGKATPIELATPGPASDTVSLLFGKGGGTIDPGRHIVCPPNTPICNLWLSLMERMGVQMERFGDSTGRMTQLNV